MDATKTKEVKESFEVSNSDRSKLWAKGCQCGTVECQKVSAMYKPYPANNREMYCTTIHKGSGSVPNDTWDVVVREYGRPGVIRGKHVSNHLESLSKIHLKLVHWEDDDIRRIIAKNFRCTSGQKRIRAGIGLPCRTIITRKCWDLDALRLASLTGAEVAGLVGRLWIGKACGGGGG